MHVYKCTSWTHGSRVPYMGLDCLTRRKPVCYTLCKSEKVQEHHKWWIRDGQSFSPYKNSHVTKYWVTSFIDTVNPSSDITEVPISSSGKAKFSSLIQKHRKPMTLKAWGFAFFIFYIWKNCAFESSWLISPSTTNWNVESKESSTRLAFIQVIRASKISSSANPHGHDIIH